MQGKAALIHLVNQIKPPPRPRIGLALSGGIAYGITHVGVLRFLEEIGLPVDIVVGTSAGSVVGALWSSGFSSDEMYHIAKNTDWLFLAKPAGFKSGLLNSAGIEAWLNRILDNKEFKDLECKFAATATDFNTGQLVVLSEGSVAAAVRISCNLPSIYQPVKYGQQLLVDGGLVQNLPAQVCRSLGAEIVIGVDLHGDWINQRVPRTVILSLIHAMNILQRQHELVQIQYVDVLVQPQIGHLSPFNFKAVDKFVDLGYAAAVAAGDQLASVLRKYWEERT